MASETGFITNNEMDDSAHRPPVPTPLAACSLLSAAGQCSQAKEPQISRYGGSSCVIETNLPFCFSFLGAGDCSLFSSALLSPVYFLLNHNLLIVPCQVGHDRRREKSTPVPQGQGLAPSADSVSIFCSSVVFV